MQTIIFKCHSFPSSISMLSSWSLHFFAASSENYILSPNHKLGSNSAIRPGLSEHWLAGWTCRSESSFSSLWEIFLSSGPVFCFTFSGLSLWVAWEGYCKVRVFSDYNLCDSAILFPVHLICTEFTHNLCLLLHFVCIECVEFQCTLFSLSASSLSSRCKMVRILQWSIQFSRLWIRPTEASSARGCSKWVVHVHLKNIASSITIITWHRIRPN